jgi:hypothetical protein
LYPLDVSCVADVSEKHSASIFSSNVILYFVLVYLFEFHYYYYITYIFFCR